jgi:hypothetical protein
MVRSSEALTVAESGSAEGYVVYAPAANLGAAVVDVASKADHCVVVKASYVILRGLTLQNARVHGVLLGDGVHDVVIEECDISGWGRIAEDGWGKDYESMSSTTPSCSPSVRPIPARPWGRWLAWAGAAP